ncbi:hypothetical protein BCU70_17210 [Vibrio sp. 10N.286.49.C2]|uniref:DUF2956 domain-containing protein n=1 Tax=unclassified Vibrio TaxID=2614977 RepID=UPI000C81D1D9|nr:MULTISPECIES: DUF2956 domain-containing protein [unclassified Vibrio]PMH36812.1 hypothetical protein BCU70_17210 [Vibrio sp. 10N.286.49.C2]PMH46975.1 hypothetical protein BCU66_22315 [Vibrio sp. 10N.286.49.B1]PMH82627.1 hypothetical protein BCU58_17540 [Vibrio sp. 10N.286.48.B7]
MKNQQPVPSVETQQEAMRIAKSTQKPGQTKEQTRIVAQGIEKGIALYKKQQKEKKRQADRALKKQKREKLKPVTTAVDSHNDVAESNTPTPFIASILPWCLLAVSWIGFITYVFY